MNTPFDLDTYLDTIAKILIRSFLVGLLILFCYSSLGFTTPQITHVGMVAPDIIEMVVQTGTVHVGVQRPYEEQEGDTIVADGHNDYLFRNGKNIGVLVGENNSMLRPFDTFEGKILHPKLVENPENYHINPIDSPQEPFQPTAIYQKIKPTNVARFDNWKFNAPIEYHLFLKLPQSLKEYQHYHIDFERDFLPTAVFRYQPNIMRSEAVHVSHIGFHPQDPVKVAFLSCWMGTGGGVSYPNDLPFYLIENESGSIVFSGTAELTKPASEKNEDAYQRNYNFTDVHEMYFSEFDKPGEYCVYVEGIGCSFPFRIATDVWQNAFKTSARGFYHQRSGIELGPPYTDFKRPRSFHPDDGVEIYHSTTRLMDTRNGISQSDPNNFRNLVAGKTEQRVENAWGAYMDAGDWDRRIQHLISSLYLLELAELYPEFAQKLSLNIPESDNPIPDIVDEALFNLDGYRRMQTPEGGIRGGIESEEHPNYGETSWQESLTIMTYAPGSWSSFYYAGVAAKAAYVLNQLGHKELADIYKESALLAMQWAEADYAKRDQRPDSYTSNGVTIERMDHHIDVRDKRNYAAAELYRLTGEQKWNDIFLQTTKFTKPNVDLYVWQNHHQREAAWIYVRTKHEGIDEKVQSYCRQATLKEANDRLRTQSKTAFRWAKHDWAPPSTTMSVSDVISVVRAHILTGDVKYHRALILACQNGLGANPANICYTTHVGHRWPQHPLHLDSRHTGQAPPEGLTVFGPVDPIAQKDNFGQEIAEPHLTPDPQEWPIIESYWDIFWYPVMCEFTIHHPMAQNAYIWGYLAGLSSTNPSGIQWQSQE